MIFFDILLLSLSLPLPLSLPVSLPLSTCVIYLYIYLCLFLSLPLSLPLSFSVSTTISTFTFVCTSVSTSTAINLTILLPHLRFLILLSSADLVDVSRSLHAYVHSQGHTFDRSGLLQWLKQSHVCPLTNQPLKKQVRKTKRTLLITRHSPTLLIWFPLFEACLLPPSQYSCDNSLFFFSFVVLFVRTYVTTD